MKDYADETTLQADSTGHTINELKLSIGSLAGIHFETPGRKIMEQAHEYQQLYIESNVEEKVSKAEEVNNLKIMQIMVVENRGDRDPEAMHLVFEIIKTDEEGELIMSDKIPLNKGDRVKKSELFNYIPEKSYYRWQENNLEKLIEIICNIAKVNFDIDVDFDILSEYFKSGEKDIPDLKNTGKRKSFELKTKEEKYSFDYEGKSYIWDENRGWRDEMGMVPPIAKIEQLNKLLEKEITKADKTIKNVNELLKRARTARDNNQLKRACNLCRRVLKKEEKNKIARAIFSSILRKQGEPEKALKVTEDYKNSTDKILLTSRAAAYCDIGEWEKAKKTIDRVLGLKESPDARNVWRRIKKNRPELF